MESYLNFLPSELIVIISTYSDITEFTEIPEITTILIKNWWLLFNWAFPDVDINHVEVIDYTSKDYNLMSTIFYKLQNLYKDIKHGINRNAFNHKRLVNELVEDITHATQSEEEQMERLNELHNEASYSYEISISDINNSKLYMPILKERPDILLDHSLKDIMTENDSFLLLGLLDYKFRVGFSIGNDTYDHNPIGFKQGITLLMYALNLDIVIDDDY